MPEPLLTPELADSIPRVTSWCHAYGHCLGFELALNGQGWFGTGHSLGNCYSSWSVVGGKGLGKKYSQV